MTDAERLARNAEVRRVAEETGFGYKLLAERLGIPKSTVRNILESVERVPGRTSTPEFREKARLLWAEGKSVNEIAAGLDTSRNVIVGIANRNRVDFPRRGSPIGKTADPSKPVSDKVRRARERDRARKRAAQPEFSAERRSQGTGRLIGPTLAIPRHAPVASPLPQRKPTACCWPNGEPGTRDFHFCGDLSVPGRPYCRPHCDRAYVAVQREAA